MVQSPRRTRSRAAALARKPQATSFEDDEDSELVPETSPEPATEVSVPGLIPLPANVTSSHTGLGRADQILLRRKQAWLAEYSITVPRHFEKHKQAVEATLVFAQEEAGTAICISPEGLILTCSHCIAETEDEWEESKVHWLLFRSGRAVGAKCVAWDPRRDLALLQVVAAQPSSSLIAPAGQPVPNLDDKKVGGGTMHAFPHAAVATSPPPVDSRVVCVGHPGSEDLEASQPGIKTNYDVLHVSTGCFRGSTGDLQDNSVIGALMHDAWTYWGHSGAPLFGRSSGLLIGLHSSWDDETGMRHGIPLEAIRQFMEENRGRFSSTLSDVTY